jgi:hypothetical protein
LLFQVSDVHLSLLFNRKSPHKANNAAFTILALRAQEEIPNTLRMVCNKLSTDVEQAIVLGEAHVQILGKSMRAEVEKALGH